MQTKYLPLIKYLFEADAWVTAATLSNALDISKRTVKNYVSDLNTSYEAMILSSSKGYHINPKVASKALQEAKSSIPQTVRERASYIMKQLSKQPTSVYDLCEELFISNTTLRNVLPRIRTELENFDLELCSSGDLLWINGLEKNKRKLLSQLLYRESNENFVNLETIQNAFPDIDVIMIKTIVLEILSEYQYFINDYSLSNLVLHIAIAADRMRNHIGQTEYDVKVARLALQPHEYEMSQKMLERLEKHFQLNFSENEAAEMTLLLLSRATSLNYNSITMDNLVSIIGEDCMELVHELISAVSSFHYINLNESEFLIRFALHIKNLLLRAQNEHFCKNPMRDTIKASCPLIYDNAVACSGIIKEMTGISINDDEIGYLAFHLGSTLEAQKELANKLAVIIYCPTYYNMDNRLYTVLNERFHTEFMIANVVTEEQDLFRLHKCDLVISTAPVSLTLSYPVLQVQPFLREADIRSIRRKVDEIKFDKKKKRFTTYLKQIILPELFEHGTGFSGGKEEAIHTLCRKLETLGYVDENFETEVLEREEMSSTEFQNFSIPHAMKMRAKKTGMYVYLSDPPTQWDESSVSLIIMLCFKRDERYIFNEVFEPLTMILTEPATVKKLLTLHTYDEFISFLQKEL